MKKILVITGMYQHLKTGSFYICLTSLVLGFFAVTAVEANPVLDSVAHGNVSVEQPNSTTTVVNQTSEQAIVNWHSFNIQQNEHTHFQQPTNGVALNRINPSQGASQIFGQLSATGRIILVNQAGIYFGSGAHVDVGGIIASTSAISNANFLQNKFIFDQPGYADATVINYGTINAADHGLVALLAPHVENNGMIQAHLGEVVLLSGNKFTVDFNGDGLLNFSVDEKTTNENSGITNTGHIVADGGVVFVSAQSAKNVLDRVINMEGVVETKSVMEKNGQIILLGGDEGTVRVAGNLDASGYASNEKGGKIHITGKQVLVDSGAVINVSGNLGGGEILIGGDYQGKGSLSNAVATVVAPTAKLYADSISHGDGGKIIVWADHIAKVYGKISAKGGALSGNGGFVETSGKILLDVRKITVDLSAENGGTGTWLLDPYNVTISNAADSDGTFDGSDPNVFTPTGTGSNVNTSTLIANLGTANVTISTTGGGAEPGDITIVDSFNLPFMAIGNEKILRLDADNSIIINSGVQIYTNRNTLYLNAIGGDITVGDSGFIQGDPFSFGQARGQLEMHAAGTITINSPLGFPNAFATLIFDAPTTILNTNYIYASAQTYNTNVQVTDTTTPVSISTPSGSFDFNTYIFSPPGNDLTFNGSISGPGSIAIKGNIFLNGGTAPSVAPSFMSMIASTSLKQISIGGIVVSDGRQDYFGTVNLTNDSTLTSNNGDINFLDNASTLSSINGLYNLTLDAPNGTAQFAGTIGDIAPIGNLTVTAADIQVNSNIMTEGSQIYNGLVSIADLVTFTGNNVMSFLGGITTATVGAQIFLVENFLDTVFTISDAISDNFSNIYVGSGAPGFNNSLALENLGNPIWNITGTDVGNVTSLTGYNGNLLFDNIKNLTGSSTGNNTFVFSDGASISGTINGGDLSNMNTLDYSAYTTLVKIVLNTTNEGLTQNSIEVAITNFNNINYSTGSNTGTSVIYLPNKSNTVNVTGYNEGYINDPFNFTNYNSLVGVSGSDTVIFDVPATTDPLNGTADIGGQTMYFSNIAFYSPPPTPPTPPAPSPEPSPTSESDVLINQIIQSTTDSSLNFKNQNNQLILTNSLLTTSEVTNNLGQLLQQQTELDIEEQLKLSIGCLPAH